MKPTLKYRERYVLIKADAKKQELEKEIKKAVKEMFGLEGLAKSGIKMVFHKGTNFIVKVNHTEVDRLKAALILIEKPFKMTIPFVSGSIKKVKIHLKTGNMLLR